MEKVKYKSVHIEYTLQAHMHHNNAVLRKPAVWALPVGLKFGPLWVKNFNGIMPENSDRDNPLLHTNKSPDQ